MTGPAIDPAVLAQLREELAPEDLAAVASAYRKDALAILQAMRAAAEAGDAAAWQRGAHRLAGGASAVGARTVEAAARAMMAARGLPDEPFAPLAALEQDVQASIAALRPLDAGG